MKQFDETFGGNFCANSSEHKKWIFVLEQLKVNLEKATKEWSILYGEQYKMKLELESEVLEFLKKLSSNIYSRYEREVGNFGNSTLNISNCFESDDKLLSSTIQQMSFMASKSDQNMSLNIVEKWS
jgi:hypothetical protein